MICKFCHQKLTQVDHYTVGAEFNCNDCHVDYIVRLEQKEIVHYYLYHNRYRICVSPLDNLFKIEYNIRPPGPHYHYKTVIKINVILDNLTPSNLAAKLQTILTFQ